MLQPQKIFLDNFINIVENNKDIGIKFEKSSSNYADLHEFYIKYLNPNEMNKKHIKAIYESSIFNLNQVYPNYKCNVEYFINNKKILKGFEEILDLRDIALLRKKDQNNENYFS